PPASILSDMSNVSHRNCGSEIRPRISGASWPKGRSLSEAITPRSGEGRTVTPPTARDPGIIRRQQGPAAIQAFLSKGRTRDETRHADRAHDHLARPGGFTGDCTGKFSWRRAATVAGTSAESAK